MLSLLMLAALCCFVQGDQLQLQVDDNYILWADGEQISTGHKFNQVYSVNRDSYSVLAIYAENVSGFGGIALNIRPGWPTPNYWHCKTVNSLADAPAGWKNRHFSYSGFKRAVPIEGGNMLLDQGKWFWSADGGNKVICRVDFTVEVKLQVDDDHELYDSSGLISSGSGYATVFEAEASNYLALYASSGSGPFGILMAINGSPTPAGQMRCKAVSGTKAAIDAANPGWKEPGFNYSQWPLSGPASNPVPVISLTGSPVLWAAGSDSDKVICRVQLI